MVRKILWRREWLVIHSSTLDWRSPSTEEPGGDYSPWGHKESGTTEQLTLFHFTMGEALEAEMRKCCHHSDKNKLDDLQIINFKPTKARKMNTKIQGTKMHKITQPS